MTADTHYGIELAGKTAVIQRKFLEQWHSFVSVQSVKRGLPAAALSRPKTMDVSLATMSTTPIRMCQRIH